MRLILILAATLLLAACGRDRDNVRPDVPRGVLVQPKVITVTRTVYRDVPPQYTDPLPIAEGPLSQCPLVAADRKKQLQKANAHRASTRALSGTEAKP